MNSGFSRIVNSAGASAMQTGSNLLAMVRLFLGATGILFRSSRTSFGSLSSQMSRQMLYTGVEAFGLVSIIALICGSTIVMQAMTNMPRFGVSEYFGKILVITVVRELGPFFTSLVVIGRSGAALAAYIGTMRVNKEIAALEVMGIDPLKFLVVPALASMVGAIVCLNVYFDIVAIIGGLLAAQLTVHIPLGIFLLKVLDALTAPDILISTVKSCVFGIIIATVSCHSGFAVRTIRGVPGAAINSVVGSMAGTIVVNVVVTIGMVMAGVYAR
ncbi:MAG: ABC transporter permease [Chitinispirillaceae bacterium]|jgi:phospholipid/cholesterol/gamma-HCH transport system permease protein|nr:ABC transporter permease [Chitinispirillaceae bacterium]